MKTKIFLVTILILFKSLALSGSDEINPYDINTGYDLYLGLKNAEKDAKNQKWYEFANGCYAYGLFSGVIVGGQFMNGLIQSAITDFENISKNSKTIKNIQSLDYNYPKDVSIGQITMIYIKWAENNPEKLNEAYFHCIHRAFYEAFMNKKQEN